MMYSSQFLFLCSTLSLLIAAVQAWQHQSFMTVPFNPPVFNVTKSGDALAPGYILLTTTGDPNPASVIMTDEGELVWSSIPGPYSNFQVATVNNKQVLAFWNGTDSPPIATTGHGWGNVQMLDDSYTQVYNICPQVNVFAPEHVSYPCQGDLHESYVTDHCTIIVSAYNATQADLTSVGGPSDGYVLDCLFFEIDINTQDVLFSWSALGSGIPISDTFQALGPGTASNPFDYFHINSIQALSDGYLINSRHMWSTYKISQSGEVEWRFEVNIFPMPQVENT
jgi:Arylsulfotransferase (ASST)